MLERVDLITKVGLFEGHKHTPDCDFGEITLIYGENGVGKSTLAAIFDSLREGNAEALHRRRSLPGAIAPTVTVSLDGKTYQFDGTAWDAQPPHDTLDVFFPGFVSRNVHAATAIDTDQRRNLCEFALGRTAVASVARLAEADKEARQALADKKQIETELGRMIKGLDSLEAFLGLPADPEVETKLEAARADLKRAQSSTLILARPVPGTVPLPASRRDEIDGVLAATSDTIGSGAAAAVKAHVEGHLDPEGEAWLAYGAMHAGDGRCPFCAQALEGSALFGALRDYFSVAYNSYISDLNADLARLRSDLGPTAFGRLRAEMTTQLAAAAQWTDMVPVELTEANEELIRSETAWMAGARDLDKLLATKQVNPLVAMSKGSAEQALGKFDEALELLVRVNAKVDAARIQVEAKRGELAAAKTTDLEQRLHRLENQQLRYQPAVQDMLARRVDLIANREARDREKTELKAAIDEHAARVVGKYQDGINHYLNYFGSDISIDAVEPAFPSGKASVQYKLKAHGHDIPLGISGSAPNFETVLSDGDKYCLALAFFLARLRAVDDLAGRVVVLDDPTNNLGNARTRLVESVIVELKKKGAQMIVLTHDDTLAALVWHDRAIKSAVPLRVVRVGKTSRLEGWDIERAMRTVYVTNYLALQAYVDGGGDHERPAGCIRPYIEQRLRHLYPGPPFASRDTLGEMIRKIRESKPGDRIHPLNDKLRELEDLNSAGLPSHHATDDSAGLVPLTPEAVRLFATRALAVL